MGQSSANNSDISRRIENIVRAGTVTQVDHGAARCRVKSGALETDWLPWLSLRAGNVRRWSPPSIGEQSLVLSPGGDMASGIVLVGIFSDAAPANGDSADVDRATYPDGAVIEYDHAAHTLTATLPGGATADITVPGSVTVRSESITLDSPRTTTTGELIVQGLLTWQAGMSGSGGTGDIAGAVVQGTIRTTEDVVANGISLTQHTHTGVQPGGGSTGVPQ